MTIDVSRIAKGVSIPVDFTESVMVADKYGLLNPQVMLTVNGQLLNTGDIFELDARLTATLAFACGKCLAACEYLLDVDFTESYKSYSDDKSFAAQKSDEFWPFYGGMIELTQASLSNLLINIPMRLLCKEDCLGLCHICGHDLNDGGCGCDKTYTDPRFEALRMQFFNKDQS